MNPGNAYCPACGFLLEPDCDFCPSCGSAKGRSENPRPISSEPHTWMKVSSTHAQPPVSGPLVQAAPPAQVQYIPDVMPSPSAVVQDTGLGATVRTMGIIAISLMLIGFIPCLGWLNYLNLTFSFVTVILSIVAIASAKTDSVRSSAVLGLALVVVAICLGIGRLIIGGGCL
jgi:hypothetical protein